MFKLALACSQPDVRVIEELPSTLISEWLAYDQLDRIPDSYWQTGLLCSVIANAMGSRRRRFTPDEFIPRQQPKRVQSIDEMMKVMQGVSALQAARESQKSQR